MHAGARAERLTARLHSLVNLINTPEAPEPIAARPQHRVVVSNWVSTAHAAQHRPVQAAGGSLREAVGAMMRERQPRSGPAPAPAVASQRQPPPYSKAQNGSAARSSRRGLGLESDDEAFAASVGDPEWSPGGNDDSGDGAATNGRRRRRCVQRGVDVC